MIGTTISHYKIESELGRGGMGVVYQALDTSLDRTVALKFLPPMIGADELAEARFINEAKAVSALDHPNIAVVHEIDRSEDGQLFIVMACYEGETLEDKIEGGPLDLAEALDYTEQIASGLQRAHEAEITHRDIKPGNVMVTERGLVKILDFGLAKMQNSTLTMAGVSLGTLSYMSPEQAQGQAVDHRTDLWAVGVILFEMLTGSRPFEGPYDAAILYSAANEQHQSVLELRPEIPEYVATIVDRLLEKNPDNRFQCAGDLLSALKYRETKAEVGVSASAERPASSEAADEGSTTRERTPSAQSRQSTTITFSFPSLKDAGKVRSFGFGIGVLIIAASAGYWALKPDSRPSVDASGAANQESTATTTAREQARLHMDQGMAYLEDRQFSLAQAELERALASDSTYSAAWSSIAALHVQVGDFDRAIGSSRTAIRLDSSNEAAYYNLGYALQDADSLDEAIEAYTSAVKWNARSVPAYSAWGNALIENNRPTEALQVLERGRTAVPGDPLLYLIYRNMGRAHFELQEYEDAISYLESTLQIKPDLTDAIALLAESYEATGQTQKSRETWERYLEHETDPMRRRAAQLKISG